MKPIAKKRFVWKFRKPFSLWFSFACTPILLHEWLHLPTNRHHQDILRQSRHTSDPLSLFSFWTAVCFLLSLCIHKICSSNKETLSCNYTKNHQNTKPGLRFTGVPLLFGWSPEVKNANFPTVQLSKSWGHKLQSKYSFCLRSANFGFTSTSSSLSSSWDVFFGLCCLRFGFPKFGTWPLVQLLQLPAGPAVPCHCSESKRSDSSGSSASNGSASCGSRGRSCCSSNRST